MAREPSTRRGAKSASAYRTISEVAEEINVPAHVLRFWESKFPSIKPLKRGGGRRYYRPEDVEALRRIRKLLYDDGFTIRGVQKLLKTHGGNPPAGFSMEESAAPAVAAAGVVETAEPSLAQPQAQLDFGLSTGQIDKLRAVISDLRGMRQDLSTAV
jgi:DNA-binding transcriptional MerR regulator